MSLPAALLLAAAPAAAQMMGPPDLDPAEFASPSGRYVLRVDPTARDGAGPADCRLALDGEAVWEERLPFTFRTAVLTDEGLACGYAYTEGLGQFEGGELVLAMVDADGEVVMRDAHPREPAGMHSPDAPTCAGIDLLPEARQVIARIYPRGTTSSETWWVFDLDRRGRVRSVPMESTVAGGDDFYGTLALRPVTGTPLVLAQWKRLYGTGFTLLDDDFEPAWGLSLTSDYRGVENRDSMRLRETMESGAGIPPSASGTFAIWHFADRVLVNYSVEPDGARWRVEELESAPREWEERAELVRPDPPAIELEPLGEILLRAEPGDAEETWLGWRPVRDGIEGIRRSTDGGLVWTFLDEEDGAAQAELSFSLPEDLAEGFFEWCRLADGRWLVTLAPFEGEGCRAWAFDPERGALDELENFPCPDVDGLAGDREGGFVAIGRSSTAFVSAHAADGRRRWRKDSFCPEAVAVTRGGEVAVLDVIRHEVVLYSSSNRGAVLRTLDLDRLCGQEMNYPSELEAAPGGGLLVHDFHGDPPLWVVEESGEGADALRPRFVDGHAPERLAREARYAPDGRLWSRADGVFVRLDEEGIVDHVAGTRAAPERIHEPAEARCGPDGRLYVYDGRTAVVHVFERDGAPLHRCVPAPSDYPGPAHFPHLAIDAEGGVYVSRGGFEPGYVHYDREGARVGIEELRGGHLTFLPGSRERWVAGYDGAMQLAPDGSVAVALERHADRTWIGSVRTLAGGSDGTLLVYDGRLTFRDPEGELRTLSAGPTYPLHVQEMVRGGGWVALASWDSKVDLVRETDGAVFRFDLSAIHAEAWFDLTTPPDGSELWVFDRERRAFLRFAWPQE